jgi:hypothetical protein
VSYDSEFGALLGRLAQYWDAEDGPISWPNRPFTPPDAREGVVWLRPEVLPAVAQQISIGTSPRFRHFGVMIIQVFAPLGAGDGVARRAADKILGIYRLARVEGFRIRAPYIDPVGPGETWFQINAVVPYERDEIFPTED